MQGKGAVLQGGTGNYIEINKGHDYQLQCQYRAGYDDEVEFVQWKYYGRPVYTWYKGRTTINGKNLLLILSLCD